MTISEGKITLKIMVSGKGHGYTIEIISYFDHLLRYLLGQGKTLGQGHINVKIMDSSSRLKIDIL